MFDQIVSLVKDKVSDVVSSDSQIPEHKKDETVNVMTSSLMDGLKGILTPDNISSITSMFTGGGTQSDDGLANNLQSGVVSSLMSKVGLNKGAAQGATAAVIPLILSMLTKKVNDNNEPGFNIGSLVSAFTGNGGGEKKSGNKIMEMVGSFFGK